MAPVVTLAWLATQAATVVDGGRVTQTATWVAPLGLQLDLSLDGFAAVMVLLVSGIGVAVLTYAPSYFGHHGRELHRVAGLLTLFAGAMLGLVLADNVLFLFVCWELTSVTSYLLIGFDDRSARARAAALQAFLVTGAGGLALLAGLVLLAQDAGTYQLSALLADPPSGPAVGLALVLVLVGACTKSAQYPFASWLPGAMVAPTPVSAYLHSATMVKAGIYLVARFSPAFADQPVWRPVVLTVGLVTMLAGGLRALRQHDLKLLLAFGTISQLGFLLVLLGVGLPGATLAGVVLLIAHALFKAALFMVVGIVDHQAGTRDLRALSGFGPRWRPVGVVAVVSAASMAGIPLTLGFIAKEEAYSGLADAGAGWAGPVLAVVVAASMLTFAYSARFVWGTFHRSERHTPDAPPEVTGVAPPPRRFLAPAGVLAVLTVLFGVAPALLDGLVGAATDALDGLDLPADLALWHGANLALLLSAVTFAGGAILFLLREPVRRLQGRVRGLPTGEGAYLAVLRGINRTADRVTGVLQNGSLPLYAAVILATAALLPLAGYLAAAWWPGWPAVADGWVQVLVAVFLVVGGLSAAVAQRRFAAALLLGSVGYGMALLFVVQGAPDLALTQFSIETLSIVLFVLVFRFLPDRFDRPRRRPTPTQALRLATATAVGAVVFVLSIVMAGARRLPPVSEEMVDRALPEGGGANVVNVILVDIRGLDTLGEITVLAVAGLGATALARAGLAGRRRAARPAEEARP